LQVRRRLYKIQFLANCFANILQSFTFLLNRIHLFFEMIDHQQNQNKRNAEKQKEEAF